MKIRFIRRILNSLYRLSQRIEKISSDIVDAIIRFRALLAIVISLGIVFLILYFLNINIRNRSEHVLTYLFFGIVTVLGFFLAYRILFYIRPVLNMQQYVEYLTEILKRTTSDSELIILAATPNPGLAEYLEDNRNRGHYYQKYKDILIRRVKDCGLMISYHILPFNNAADGSINLVDGSPMMKFLDPFMNNIEDEEQKGLYKTELLGLMNEIAAVLKPTSPVTRDGNRGLIAIYHPSMGFIGVYDGTGGVLRVRGATTGEPVFLTVIKEVINLVIKK